jgi:RND superfamily putative drug exporter
MLFDRIANGLTKHYKKVLIVWIIILLISVPAILQVNNVIDYQQTQSATGNYESVQAQNIISAVFQKSVANGTLLIVLQANNITDANSRDFVLELQQRIENSSNVKDLQSVTSVYTSADLVMEQYIMQLGPSMRSAEAQINANAFLLWGIPALQAANWNQNHSDSAAFNATETQLIAELKQQQADQNTTAVALSYYHTFAAEWNSTSGNVILDNPAIRADYCVNIVAPSFINQLPVPSSQQQMLMAVLAGFNLTNFNDVARVHAFALSMIGTAASINNMTFLQQVYELGPSYQPAVVSNFVDSIVANGTLATYPITIPEQLTSNFVSSNNRTMLVMVSFTVTSTYTTSDGDKPMTDDVGILRGIISNLKSETGSPITTYVTGDAAMTADMQTSSTNDMSLIMPITITIIIVLMGLLFRSVLGEFLPLGAVGVALGISEALVFVIGSTVAQINSSTLTMLFSILIGVGTDYSVFIIMRYREERIKGSTREQAVHTSVTWAGESIVTSGATVVIAFFAMATSSFAMVQTMGLVLGMAIVVALLVALTLIPSILMLVGNRIFWPTTGQRWKRFADRVMERKRAGNHGYFHRAASFAVHHAKVIVVAAILISIPTTYLFVTTETNFDFIDSMGTPESIRGMNAMTSDFGAGRIMPTQIVITGDTLVYDGSSFNDTYLNAIDNITATIAADPMVQQVTGITRPYGEWVDYNNMSSISAEERQQMLQSLGSDNKTVLLTIVLKQQPESATAVNFIPTLRDELAKAQGLQPALAGSTILVGGTSASLYDLSLTLTGQFDNIVMLVVIGIFIVLMIVLGSLLLPAFAIVSIAMSISWSFAATVLVFGSWLGKPILFIIPLILFVMLMGLGMDYNVFILTRIREEVHKGKDTRQAVVDAVDWTGGIISALALIMAGAFGSMMLSSNTMLQEFGFALTLAILLDAMVVRTYIVPAAMMLMGKKAWWAPGILQREGRREKKLPSDGSDETVKKV